MVICISNPDSPYADVNDFADFPRLASMSNERALLKTDDLDGIATGEGIGGLYYPYWETSVFGPFMDDEIAQAQSKVENERAIIVGLLYSPEVIKAGFRANYLAMGYKREYSGLYPDYDRHVFRCHPIHIQNYIRYLLRNEICGSISEIMQLVGNGHFIKQEEVLIHNNKFVNSPSEIPEDTPLAIIHGRFLGVPHEDYERAFSILSNLKEANPALRILVLVDELACNIGFANTAFKMSLLAHIPEADYVSYISQKRVPVNPLYGYFKPIIDSLSKSVRNEFYTSILKKWCLNRPGCFLYVNSDYPEELQEEFKKRCEAVGNLKPFMSSVLPRWSTTILSGHSYTSPQTYQSPYDGRMISFDHGYSKDLVYGYNDYLTRWLSQRCVTLEEKEFINPFIYNE